MATVDTTTIDARAARPGTRPKPPATAGRPAPGCGSRARGLLIGLALLLAASTPCRAERTYTGVWRGGTDNHFFTSEVGWSDFVQTWQLLGGQNLRLDDLETYVEGGVRRFTGTWRSGSDAYALWVGADWNGFVQEWQRLSALNLRLIDLETYVEGGIRKYAGVWRGGSDSHYLWVGADWNGFVQKWQELGRLNLRLIDVETYHADGAQRYAGVWRRGTDAYALWQAGNWSDFVSKWQELAAKGVRLIDIESYPSGGETRFVGVWRGGNDDHYLWKGGDWENFRSRSYHLGQAKARLVDVEVDQGQCGNVCSNQVVAKSPYSYGITRTATHCPGAPGTCTLPGPAVAYHWPVDDLGSDKYVRLSAIEHHDQFLILPFVDRAVKRRGIWLYAPGSWHHAADYSRDDEKSFAVTAAASGRVIHVGWDNWSGNTVVMSHDVGGVPDAYRTIYMHLRNGASNDCGLAWSATVPSLAAGSVERANYIQHLNATGCTQNPATRHLDAEHWGTDKQTIRYAPGKTVGRGRFVAWAGNTGPGGKSGLGGPNTHLHIFFARRDLSNDEWYFFDPYGIYGPPQCYPSGVTDPIGGPCARYPVAWLGGKPLYP